MDDVNERDIHHAEEGAATGRSLVVDNTGPATRTIVVNGRQHRFTGDEIGRNELARLAFPGIDTGTRGALTVAYDRGAVEAPSGLLAAGRTTRVLDGQTFSVSLTDKS